MKAGDKVKILENHNGITEGFKGKIKKIVTHPIDKLKEYLVEIECGETHWLEIENFELIPEYKTLAELLEESKNPAKVFTDTAINARGILLLIYEDSAIIAENPHDPETYTLYDATISAWQLYQEPEEESVEFTVNVDLADFIKEPEEKPAEKCEHKSFFRGGIGYYKCQNCGAKLEERWRYLYIDPCNKVMLSFKHYASINDYRKNHDKCIIVLNKVKQTRGLFEVEIQE
ncbi:hypothetical protein KAR91_30770 [Candidatus Pacearchaeota archaeon]|nr:hypothetical protein [Candidatus Pacearchaeota archaeon]